VIAGTVELKPTACAMTEPCLRYRSSGSASISRESSKVEETIDASTKWERMLFGGTDALASGEQASCEIARRFS